MGCWIFTATVLPSCSTALCTWASDAAPKGVSSKLMKSSFICQEKRKRHQLGVTEAILRKALPAGQRALVPKLGRLRPFILLLSPPLALSLFGLQLEPAKRASALEILCLRKPVAEPQQHVSSWTCSGQAVHEGLLHALLKMGWSD